MAFGRKEMNEVFSRFFKRKPKKTSEASAIKDTKSLIVKKLGLGLFQSASSKNDFADPEIDLEQIENAYLTDSYIRTSVDKHVDYMFKSGWDLTSKNQAALDYVKQRIRIMEIGTGVLFEQLLEEMAGDLIKYHNVYVVKNRKKGYPFPAGIKSTPLDGLNPVTGWFCLSPIYMKVNRAENGDINSYQQAITGEGEVEFKKADVVHMVVDRPTGRAYGLPYLWQVLDDVKILRQLEELTDRMIYKNIFPLITYTVGLEAEGMQSTDEEIETVKETLGSLELDAGLVLPERHKVGAVKVDPIDISSYLEYFENRVFTGLGVSAVLMGRGSTSNRSTSDTLDSTFRDRVKSYQNVLSSYITRMMIQEILLEGGFDPILTETDEVSFRFKEIDFDAKIKQENHAIQKFTQGSIVFEELRMELGMDPVVDEARLYYNMVSASRGEDAANDAATAANNKGDNKDKPENQNGKKDSPGKTSTRKDSVKNIGLSESYKENEYDINNEYDRLKEYIISNTSENNISYYDLKIKSGLKSIIEKAKKHIRSSYLLGMTEVNNQLGITSDDIYDVLINTELIEARVEKYFMRFLENDIPRQIERILKNTSDINSRRRDIKKIFENSKYRVAFILKSEHQRAYMEGFVKQAKNMSISNIEVIGSKKCKVCAEYVGKNYNIDEVTDKDIPPYHTNCTCELKILKGD